MQTELFEGERRYREKSIRVQEIDLEIQRDLKAITDESKFLATYARSNHEIFFRFEEAELFAENMTLAHEQSAKVTEAHNRIREGMKEREQILAWIRDYNAGLIAKETGNYYSAARAFAEDVLAQKPRLAKKPKAEPADQPL